MSAGRMGRLGLAAALTLIALGVFGVSAASAATLTVCESGKPNCGFSSIQEAINAAKSGDTIKIAGGMYDEHLEIPGSGTATSLTLQGTSAGKTIIDGTNNGTVVSVSSGESVAIKGVTITEGLAISGGGIRNDGTLTVNNSTLSRNRALNGGIYNEGTLTVNNSALTSNDGGKFGGGILNSGGTVTVNNTTISHNSAVRGGGGIASDGKLTLNNSAVSNNTVDERGGGIDTEGTTILNNSAVRNNTSNQAGGGISNDHGGTLTLNNSAISGNKAAEGGGIFNEETVKGSNDSITGNTPNGITNARNEITNEIGTTELKNSRVQEP